MPLGSAFCRVLVGEDMLQRGPLAMVPDSSQKGQVGVDTQGRDCPARAGPCQRLMVIHPKDRKALGQDTHSPLWDRAHLPGPHEG